MASVKSFQGKKRVSVRDCVTYINSTKNIFELLFSKRKGVSQQALAEMANCSPTHISYCETGRRHMSVETLVRIANALHVTADELLIDSLENTVKVSNHEFSAILIDCSEYEKNVLLDVLVATKTSLRVRAVHLHKK